MFFLNIFLSLFIGHHIEHCSLCSIQVLFTLQTHTHTHTHTLRFKSLMKRVVVWPYGPTDSRKRKIKNNLWFHCHCVHWWLWCHALFTCLSIFIIFSFYSYNNNNILVPIDTYAIFSFVPTVSIFLFYFYNKMFRKELNRKMRVFSISRSV